MEENLWVNSDLNNLGVQRDPETKCFELLACRKPHKPECPRPRTFFTLCSNLRGSHCWPPGPLPGCYCRGEDWHSHLFQGPESSTQLNTEGTKHSNTLINATVHARFPKAAEATTVSITNSESSWGMGWLVGHSAAGSPVGHHLGFLWCSLGKPAPSPAHPSICRHPFLWSSAPSLYKIPLGFQILFRKVRSVPNANCVRMPEPGGCGATLPHSFCGHQFLVITKRVVTQMNDDWVDKHTKIPPETPKPWPLDTLAHSVPKHREVSVALPLWWVSRNNYHESCS